MSANFFESHIPRALTCRERWVCWRLEARKDKFTKAPINARTGHLMSVLDQSAWSNFEGAKAGRVQFGCDGLGFVLNGDGIVGIDLDNCVQWDGGDPRIDEQAEAIIRSLSSYTEFSPSRKGVHIFAFGSLPEASRRNDSARIEIYGNKQYLTVTGDVLPGASLKLHNRTDALQSVHNRFFIDRTRTLAPIDEHSTRSSSCGYRHTLDDDSLLERARSARNGARFSALFDGGSLEYPSESEADLALCLILAFWTGRDSGRIDRLFRRSARMREKWEREDYRNRTIVRALDRVQAIWKPQRY